jgi:cell division protein FtsI/penicillin-binding protein 2
MMFGRDEKVSALRLTAVQYGVLFIFLLLAYGLWRLQVMQSDKYSQLAQCANSGAAREDSGSRRAHHCR